MEERAYRDDGLERTVQLVDVGEHMLEALFFLSCLRQWWGWSRCWFLAAVRALLTMAISPMSSSRCFSKRVFSFVPDWEWEKVR